MTPMRRTVLAPLAVLAFATAVALPLAAQTPTPFTPGMVVTADTRIEAGTYRVAGTASLEAALITVRGDGVTLDLSGVTLEGLPAEADPDLAQGIAVLVEGGSDVVIRGGTIRGYRFGVVARGVRGLSLFENNLSYGWKPRLFSQVHHESLVDWLSYHNNEEREWMRFGAAIYLEDVHGGEIVGNRAVQGMNGLLMTRTDSVTVRSNDFSYNSGLGIGMYRSSHNAILRNRLDYDVRGYSHGFYNRGQDSAGLLLYEQSGHNVVAYNSATHSGDGIFLWAGQSTMDTGEGGANDNLFFHNDFSYAPTNAVEVTFSRNRILGNYLLGSRYGVWGGYSFESEIRGNCIGGNDYGVAIEHGQENRIVANRFDGDSLAVQLWARPSQPPDWIYAQRRDVRSRDHLVADNLLYGVKEPWKLERSEGHDLRGNVVEAGPAEARCDPRTLLGAAFDSIVASVPALQGIPSAIPWGTRARFPRSAIVVDEWGPYDGLSPKLWPANAARARGGPPVQLPSGMWQVAPSSTVPLQVLGPPGEWRVHALRGVEAWSPAAGVTGDTLRVVPRRGSERDWRVELEYIGAPTVSARGVPTGAGESVLFAYERFEPAGPWDVRVWTWTDPARDPNLDPAAFEALLRGAPALERREDYLDWMWYRPTIPGIPQERWGLEATTSFTLPEGEAYSLRAISDDGIRVWVDGELVLDDWEPHGSRVRYAPLTPGRHDMRVQYHQIGGWSEVRVDVVKGSARSPGSEVTVAASGAHTAVAPADPAAAFRALEERLLAADAVAFDFHVTAEGAAKIDVRGRLDLERDGQVELTATGQFGGQPVELRLTALDDDVRYGTGPQAVTGPRPPRLEEALLVGLTRMGILHNLARLTGNAAPDHADGGVREWVTVGSFSRPEGEPASVGFDITVSGQHAGSATLELDPKGSPVIRRQTVRFTSGEMRVTERYWGVTVRD